MSYLYQSVKGYIFKAPPAEPKEDEEKKKEENVEEKEVEEEEAEEEEEEKIGESDKKTDEVTEQVSQGNIVWRMTSGVYSTASSAVGMGVGGVKWVAGKSYDVGTTVVSNVKVPKLSSFRRKDKKE